MGLFDTENEEAARLIRGMRERLNKLESERDPDAALRKFADVSEQVTVSDSVTTTVRSGTDVGGTWDEDYWDEMAWATRK